MRLSRDHAEKILKALLTRIAASPVAYLTLRTCTVAGRQRAVYKYTVLTGRWGLERISFAQVLATTQTTYVQYQYYNYHYTYTTLKAKLAKDLSDWQYLSAATVHTYLAVTSA